MNASINDTLKMCTVCLSPHGGADMSVVFAVKAQPLFRQTSAGMEQMVYGHKAVNRSK